MHYAKKPRILRRHGAPHQTPADRELVHTSLQNQLNDLSAVSGLISRHRDNHPARLLDYQRWAANSAHLLRFQISADDIDRLFLTRRYWTLQAATPSEITSSVITAELNDREKALNDAVDTLGAQIRRWSEPEVFVVADTTFYVQPEETFDRIAYATLLHAAFEPVRLLIPMLIVDELDGLKRSRDSRVRGRARQALAIIDRLFSGSTDSPQRLRRADEDGGEVTVELVFDPPGHVRLPIADDELVDRAAEIQTLAGTALIGKLRFPTFDTSQSMRARHAQLEPVKMQDREEPARGS